MMSTKKIFLSLVLAVVSVAAVAQSGTVTASSSNNWNNVATWTNSITRSGTVTSSTSSTTVTGVNTNFLTELTVGSVIERTSGGTDIGTVASIQSNTSLTLTANAGITVNNLAYRTIDGPPSSVDALVINNGVTLTMNVAGTHTVASVTLNAGNSTSAITINSGVTLDVTGNITYNSGTGNNDHRTITVNGTLNAANINMVNTSGDGWDNILSIATTGTVNLDGNLVMPGSFLRNHVDMTGNAVFNIGGNVDNNAGAVGGGFTTPPSTSTINLNGSSAQTVFLYGGNAALGILKINNTAGVTSGSTMTVTTLTIGDATSNSVFSDGGNQVTSTGTLNLTSGTFTLGAGTATTFPGFGTRNISSGTYVEYAANAAQVVSTTPSYHHLSFSGSGTKTVSSGTLSVAGNWAVGSTTALNTNNPTVTVTGDISGSGNITSTSGTLSIAGNWTNNGTFTHNSGTVTYNGASAQAVGTLGYNNLTFSGTGTKTPASGTLTVAGNWSVGSTTALNTNNPTVTVTGDISGSGNITSTSGTLSIAGNWTNNGTFTHNSGTVTYNGASGQTVASLGYNNLTFSGAGTKTPASGTLTVAGNWAVGSTTALNSNNPTVTVTGDISGSGNITSTSGTLSIAGNWTNNGTFTHNSGTVTYNGASGQAVASLGYNNLTFSGAGTKTPASGTLTVAGNWAVGSTTALNTNNPTVTVTGDISGSGNITSTSGTLSIAGNWTNNGTFTHNSGTVTYNGASGQTVASLGYNNLTFSGAGTKTPASGTLTVAGNWAVGSTTALNTNNPTVTVTGDISGSGNITSTSGTLSITGNWTNNGTFTHNSGTVNYNNATGGQTIAGLVYRNLTLSNTSGTNTASGDITVGATFSMSNANAILDMVANDLSIGGSLSLSGTIKTQSTSLTPLPTGFSWGGTIEYNNATGGQTIMAGTYTNLTSSNTSQTNSAEGNIAVNGVLTVASGGTLDMVTNALSGSLTTSGTGTIQTQSNSSTPLPTGITWTPTIEYNLSNNQTVSSGTYSTLIIGGTTGIKTLGGNTTVTSGLTLTAGTLAVSNKTLTIQTTSVNSSGGGLISMSLTGTIIFSNTSTLTFADPVFSGSLGTITVSGGARVNLPSTPSNILSVLNLNLSNGTLGLGANSRLSIGGVVTMSASNCLVSDGTADLQVASGLPAVGTIYFDQTTPGTTNTIDELVFTRGSLTQTVAFGNTVRVKTLLAPTSGTVTSNGNIVIGSDINGTARIYPEINTSTFAFVGDVKVERYSKSKVQRRYIMISSPVDAISVRNAWQDDIFITGSGTGGTPCGAGTGNGGASDKYNSNGFDATVQNLVSVYRYSESGGGWLAIPNTSYTLEKGKGYRILYRGERGTNDANCYNYLQTNVPPAPSAATLNVSGTLITGNFSVNVDGPTGGNTYGYTLLGNPYACELDFTKFVATNPTEISPTYWIYDPNGTNTTTSSTTYLTYTTSGGGETAGFYHSDPGGDPANYANPGFIASGQAFFVQANTAGSVTFKETDKGSTTQAGLFKTNGLSSKVRVHLKLADNTPIDNMVVRFSGDPAVSLAENKYWDVVSFNSGTYITSMKGTRNFAIQTRPLNFYNDTVQLRVGGAVGNYKLLFTDYIDFVEAAQIILIDQFSGTQTDIKANPSYSFSITSSSASTGLRFKLVFRSMPSVMPLSYMNISATQKAQGVEVDWKVAFEQGVSKYQVERSENGNDFGVIGTVDSKGNSNTPVEYSFMDAKPLSGLSYYRVKSIENGGGKYSPIVKLNSTKAEAGISIYPNPVKDRIKIGLQHNPSFEKATITVRNSQGKLISQVANVVVNGYLLDVSGLASGVYILSVTNKNGETIIEKFIKY